MERPALAAAVAASARCATWMPPRCASAKLAHRRFESCLECRKDEAVIDETPMAYKDVDAVIAAESDLVEVMHTLKQVGVRQGLIQTFS